MKHVILLFALLLYGCMHLFGQTFFLVSGHKNIPQIIINRADELGKDSRLELTSLEAAYIQALLQDKAKQELAGKRIAFFSGNTGGNLVGKMDFFYAVKQILKDGTNSTIYPVGALYLFSDSQKEESGGYDGAIVCRSKKMNSLKTMVKRLRKGK